MRTWQRRALTLPPLLRTLVGAMRTGFQADRDAPISPDPTEFSAVRWFELNRETGWAAEQFDPQMARFVAKLSQTLDRVTAG